MMVRVIDLEGRRVEREVDREPATEDRWRLATEGAEVPGVEAGSVAGAAGNAVPAPEHLGERGALHEAVLRLLNLTVAAVSLVLAAPLLAAIAVAIKLDSPGPVLYRQLRVGMDRRRGDGDGVRDAANRTGNLGGKPFVLYKFRTMEVNAEDESGPSWSGREDDRVTRVGRFLRRHRLDELPQLWNVVKGEMAVVGPRPERPVFFQRLREVFDAYPKRQTVPPGITGWAQVNRDSDTCLSDVEHKLRYDLEYLRRRSLWFDAYIMLRTPLVMLQREAVSGDRATDGFQQAAAGSAAGKGER